MGEHLVLGLALLGRQLPVFLGVAQHQIHVPIKRHEPAHRCHTFQALGPSDRVSARATG
jgi:hypothetical protein